MPICAKATGSAKRTVMRGLSDASAMVAPPVHDLDGTFQSMVVSEASTSPSCVSERLRQCWVPPRFPLRRPECADRSFQCHAAERLYGVGGGAVEPRKGLGGRADRRVGPV